MNIWISIGFLVLIILLVFLALFVAVFKEIANILENPRITNDIDLPPE
jgi:hypothetical protein